MSNVRITAEQKQFVAERVRHCCEYCLYHPRQHKWDEHFTWSRDFARLIGLTPIGRATIIKLQLNREGVVNLRQLLRLVDKHPPS